MSLIDRSGLKYPGRAMGVVAPTMTATVSTSGNLRNVRLTSSDILLGGVADRERVRIPASGLAKSGLVRKA